MKIIFDNDDTVTDYHKFIDKYAIPYFKHKYKLEVINENALELEDIFELKNQFTDMEVKQMMDSFWLRYFAKYTLLPLFRLGVASAIRRFIRQHHEVEIHTSRAKSCEKGIIGSVVRSMSVVQYWLNGVFLAPNKFHFYETDEEKLKGILLANPALVFDDKPWLINQYVKNDLYVFCVTGRHNCDLEENKRMKFLPTFQTQVLVSKLSSLFGESYLKTANKVAKADSFFRRLWILKPIMNAIFEPIVLNKDNILRSNQPVIYASNHRSTLDPIAITSVLLEAIHWVALKRFFMAEDSIFNNSKNPILCRFTAFLFEKLALIPIERKKDNPQANNMKSLRELQTYLKLGHKVGIFPEGTTSKPQNCDFGEFDTSFINIAYHTGAYILPITVLWVKKGKRKRVIINFGKAITVQDKNYALSHFCEVQKAMLEENKEYAHRYGFEIIL